MKKYQEVKMEAKNAPTGSYAAGCPQYAHDRGSANGCTQPHGFCSQCEVTR